MLYYYFPDHSSTQRRKLDPADSGAAKMPLQVAGVNLWKTDEVP